MKSKIEEAIERLKAIEEELNVTITSRSGGYGSSYVIIIDNETNEEDKF